MKKNKIIILLICIMFLLSGCTKVLKDKDNKAITYEKSGQTITKNILCKPTNDDIIKIYKDNKINISKLPECETFSVTNGGYEGLWTSFFVKPLAWLVIALGKLCSDYGIGIILASLIIRFATFPITKKIAMQSENMKKAKPELDKLEKKYKNKSTEDKEVMMQKTQETLGIYKKYEINPLSGCLFSFLQIPVFFAFLEAVNRVPALFEDKFLNILPLGTTPLVGISNGNYWYIILVILIIGTTYFSFKLNATASSPDQAKQMKMMSMIMIVFISIASFTLASGIALYWIASSVFTIGQNLLAKKNANLRK